MMSIEELKTEHNTDIMSKFNLEELQKEEIRNTMLEKTDIKDRPAYLLDFTDYKPTISIIKIMRNILKAEKSDNTIAIYFKTKESLLRVGYGDINKMYVCVEQLLINVMEGKQQVYKIDEDGYVEIVEKRDVSGLILDL